MVRTDGEYSDNSFRLRKPRSCRAGLLKKLNMTTQNDNPYFRVFAMLYMLRADYSMFIHFGKLEIKSLKDKGLIPRNGNKKGKETKEELIYAAELDFHQKIVNEINRMHRSTDYKHQADIEKEMNSERIKDLHSFMDMILQVRNIEILTAWSSQYLGNPH